MVLNSYHAGCKYELIDDTGPPHDKRFVYKVEVLGVAYTGQGRSKKNAKHAAAAAALRSIYNINLTLGVETPTESANKTENTAATENTATIGKKSKLEQKCCVLDCE